MEVLRKIAIAHYLASHEKLQTLAHDFFCAMDQDGDGHVDIYEFMGFMKEKGYAGMDNPHLFEVFDVDKNGTLDFFEVLTLYYVVKSGRPFCNLCNKLIPETFFSCVQCFENPTTTNFSLCLHCYTTRPWNHHHNGRYQFLDNYTLLEFKRISSAKNEATTSGPPTAMVHTHNYTTTHNYNYIVPQNPNHTVIQMAPNSASTDSTSNAVIPANRRNRADVAFQALEYVVQLGNLALNVAGSCSIL